MAVVTAVTKQSQRDVIFAKQRCHLSTESRQEGAQPLGRLRKERGAQGGCEGEPHTPSVAGETGGRASVHRWPDGLHAREVHGEASPGSPWDLWSASAL